MDRESPEREGSDPAIPLPARGSPDREALTRALGRVAETASDLLDVSRVGAWLYSRDRRTLRRIHLYDASADRHSEGGVLTRRRFPDYFQALEEGGGGSLCADDALADERTHELVEPYARPLDIRAWLDAPLAPGDGPVVGVLRLEGTGGAREWSGEDREAAADLADLVERVLDRYAGVPMSRDRVETSPDSGASVGSGAGGGADPVPSELLRRLPVGLLLTDTGGEILDCNDVLAEMLGYRSPGELVGRDVTSIYASEHGRNGLVRYLQKQAGEIRRHEAEVVRRDGSPVWILENAALLPAPDRDRILSAILDVTPIKDRERELEEQAHRDPLTGLANRRLFHETAAQTLALAERYDRRAAIAYLDLAGFKSVNDRYGHDVGDRVLRATGERLQEGVRDSDLVARLGGDEFAILFAEVEGRSGTREVATRLLDTLSRPIEVNGHEFRLRAQLGVSLYPDHGRDAATLLRRADRAMYAAKQVDRDLILAEDEEEALGAPPEPLEPPPAEEEEGPGEPGGRPADREGGQVEVRALRAEPEAETTDGPLPEITEESLRRALEEDQLELHYQPIYRVPDLSLAGVEALLRWNHPSVGLLDAEEFVPRAEELDLVRALDRWAVSTAVRQLEAWSVREGVPGWIAVNVSDRSLAGLAFYLDAILGRREMEPSRLVVEVVMPAGIESIDRTARVLRYLRERGCRVALDCEAQLDDLVELLDRGAVDMIKMDRGYLERSPVGKPETPARLADVSGFFDVDVLVKRVETARQFRAARDESVSMIQGFYHGQPVPANQLRVC